MNALKQAVDFDMNTNEAMTMNNTKNSSNKKMKSIYFMVSVYFYTEESLSYSEEIQVPYDTVFPKDRKIEFNDATVYIDWYHTKNSVTIDRQLIGRVRSCHMKSHFISTPISYAKAKLAFYDGAEILAISKPNPQNKGKGKMAFNSFSKKNTRLFDEKIKNLRTQFNLEDNAEFTFFATKHVTINKKDIEMALEKRKEKQIKHNIFGDDCCKLIVEAQTKIKTKDSGKEEIIPVYFVGYDSERKRISWTRDLGLAKRFSSDTFEDFKASLQVNKEILNAMKEFSIDGKIRITRISKHITERKIE